MATSEITTAQIDDALSGARAAVGKLGTALFELDSDRQRHGLDVAGLRGLSATAWADAEKQLTVLWAWYRALSTTVERIGERRSGTKLGPRDLDELWSELSGTSVDLPADSLQLARTCLPEAAGLPDRVSIAYLTTVLSGAYQRAAETITTMVTVREMVLPRLDELEQALTSAENEARSARIQVPNEAAVLRRRLGEVRDQASTDPLAVDVEQIPSLNAALERVRATLAETVGALEDLDQALNRLTQALGAADTEIGKAQREVSEAIEKIANPGLTLDDVSSLESTAGQLHRDLEAARRSATVDPQIAGQSARALEARVAMLRSDAANIANAAAEQVSARRELRGRLDAYRAKAQALGRGEDSSLDGLYRGAQEALYTSPCDLVGGAQRVAAYQAAVLAHQFEDRQT